MELIGVKVTHKKFGKGIITKIDNGILIVKFSEREVNFQYKCIQIVIKEYTYFYLCVIIKI